MLVFAHRGASGYAPENTVKAMQLALSLGAKAIELDVHNVDGELMVFHDRRLDNKTNGQGLIHQKSLSELSKITLDGEPIPSLWQILESLSPKPLVNIELKGVNCLEPFLRIYPKIIEQLEYKAEQLLISSFNHLFLAKVKQVFPNARVAPLVEGIPLGLANVGTELNASSIHLDINFITPEIVADAKKRKLKVYVFTVDHADDIKYLNQLGVDGIFSNFPDKALQVISKL